MIKNIRYEYAKYVRTFCKSVPQILQVTTEEIDTYFRSCVLYLWSCSEQPGDTFDGLSQIYTDRQVKLTPQEIEERINFYSSNPGETINVPDFFLRLLASDRVSGTDYSRRFTDVQRTEWPAAIRTPSNSHKTICRSWAVWWMNTAAHIPASGGRGRIL